MALSMCACMKTAGLRRPGVIFHGHASFFLRMYACERSITHKVTKIVLNDRVSFFYYKCVCIHECVVYTYNIFTHTHTYTHTYHTYLEGMWHRFEHEIARECYQRVGEELWRR
jgi:hypothetical protein